MSAIPPPTTPPPPSFKPGSSNPSSPLQPSAVNGKLSSATFFGTFHGHPPDDLRRLLSVTSEPRILLLGDSTLDNKYWVPPRTETHPHQQLANLLDNSIVRRDVSYWLTRAFAKRRIAINCAVEESTLRERRSRLLDQDVVARDNLRNDDIVVVSVGGNDIALRPTFGVILAVLAQTFIGGRLGLTTLRRIFRNDLTSYLQRVTDQCQPELIVVCGLYFPDESIMVRSWASWTLRMLGYNSRPQWLQCAMRTVFEKMIREVKVSGCQMAYVPLYAALDGKESSDYVARVEPSEQGGRKMAEVMRVEIERVLQDDGVIDGGEAVRKIT